MPYETWSLRCLHPLWARQMQAEPATLTLTSYLESQTKKSTARGAFMWDRRLSLPRLPKTAFPPTEKERRWVQSRQNWAEHLWVPENAWKKPPRPSDLSPWSSAWGGARYERIPGMRGWDMGEWAELCIPSVDPREGPWLPRQACGPCIRGAARVW